MSECSRRPTAVDAIGVRWQWKRWSASLMVGGAAKAVPSASCEDSGDDSESEFVGSRGEQGESLTAT